MSEIIQGEISGVAFEVREVALGDIKRGERFRKEFGDVSGLAASINELGLINPIGLFLQEDELLLLHGERRLLAHELLGKETILARIFSEEIDDLTYRLIELHENVHREDFTPLEKNALIAETHRLLIQKHGIKHKQADTAASLKIAQSEVSRAAKYQAAIDANPQLQIVAAKAKTDSELRSHINAYIKEKAKQEKARRLAERAKSAQKTQAKNLTAEGAKKQMSGTEVNALGLQRLRAKIIDCYHVGDFFELIQQVPERSVDFMELDPDWGIDFVSRKASKGVDIGDHYTDVAPSLYIQHVEGIAKEAYRVMKDHSWAIVWYSLEFWHDATKQAFMNAGFHVSGMPGFWYKKTGNTATPAYRLSEGVAAFLYVRKGNCTFAQMGHMNVFDFRAPKKNERFHSAEKPIELYEELIEVFSHKGGNLLTGFAGSGNFILAAVNKQRNVIGFDINEKNKNNFILKVHEHEPGKYRSYKDPA